MINETSKEFKCTPERCLFSSDDYKVYGAFVNSFDYPEIKIGKYGTASLIGDLQELNWS